MEPSPPLTNKGTILIGLDLGGTNAKAAVVDHDGGVVAFEVAHLGDDAKTLAPNVVVERLLQCADHALRTSGARWESVKGVGVGTPGAIEDGVVLGAANLFEGCCPVPLRQLVADCVAARGGDTRVVLVNDADAALLAEMWTGSAKGVGDVAMLTLGSGIGCSVAVDGKIVRGHSGTLEGGHMLVSADPDARKCLCGSRGCLESYASAKSIVRTYEEKAGRRRECREIFERAAQGERDALSVVDRAARYVAVGAINLIRILDSSKVILAGGVASAGEPFLGRVREAMDELDWTCLPRGSDRLAFAAAGPHTGCVGAARASMSRERSSSTHS